MEKPLIVIPHKLKPGFVNAHQEIIFVYSFDLVGNSCFGQCVVGVGERNCFPIPVLLRYCASPVHFVDSHLETNKEIIRSFIKKIPRDGRPIIPFPKYGRGYSEMYKNAPLTYAYLVEEVDKIKYPNIQISYAQS